MIVMVSISVIIETMQSGPDMTEYPTPYHNHTQKRHSVVLWNVVGDHVTLFCFGLRKVSPVRDYLSALETRS